MISIIREKFESLTYKRHTLLQDLGSLSTDKLYFKAGPDKWSVVEVVEHLVIVEDDLIKQISTQVQSFDRESRSPEKYKTVVKVMERDIPVDVPDESMEPQGRLTLEELLSHWDGLREKLQEFLAGINSENKDNLVYRHPFAGPLDISETLHFVDIHFDNHMRHINRIIAQRI
jgi:hypothetical protein